MLEDKPADSSSGTSAMAPEAPVSPPESSTNAPSRRGRGRPRKDEIAAKKPGGRGKVGRPKGDAAIINEYKARMLASPKSALVLQKILDVSLDDEHKHQASCMKMVIDRMLPLGYFEKEGSSAPKLTVTINTGGGPVDIGSGTSPDDMEPVRDITDGVAISTTDPDAVDAEYEVIPDGETNDSDA